MRSFLGQQTRLTGSSGAKRKIATAGSLAAVAPG
jgi:hypothetical protein